MPYNPFSEKRAAVPLPRLVTRLAAMVIAGKSYRDLKALCIAMGGFGDNNAFLKLLAAEPFSSGDDYAIAYPRLREYAHDYMVHHRQVLT